MVASRHSRCKLRPVLQLARSLVTKSPETYYVMTNLFAMKHSVRLVFLRFIRYCKRFRRFAPGSLTSLLPSRHRHAPASMTGAVQLHVVQCASLAPWPIKQLLGGVVALRLDGSTSSPAVQGRGVAGSVRNAMATLRLSLEEGKESSAS